VCYSNNKGQSFLEGIIVATIITIFMFTAIQACIMVVDDMYANYSAFHSTRKIVVSKTKDIANIAKDTVSKLFIPYMANSASVKYYKTTHWDENILGKNIVDHSGKSINKHNVKIAYYMSIMFPKLFGNVSHYREQSARARMVKSPDEQFYNKAYPNAREFPKYEK